MEKAVESLKAHENQYTIPRMLRVNNNSNYPTAAEVWSESNSVYHTIGTPQQPRIALLIGKDKRPSVPTVASDDIPKGTTPLLSEREDWNTGTENRQRLWSEGAHSRSQKSTTEINRPLYRDDIFFGASLTRLPKFSSQSSMVYNLAVTRIPTQKDVEEEKQSKCTLCPEAFRRTLATMLDFSLLKSPTFLIMAISGAFTMMGFYVPFMYITDRAVINGMSPDRAVWLISTIGIANTVGRVLSGILSSLPGVNVLLVNNTALTIGGISTILSGMSASDNFQFSYAVTFGMAIGKQLPCSSRLF